MSQDEAPDRTPLEDPIAGERARYTATREFHAAVFFVGLALGYFLRVVTA